MSTGSDFKLVFGLNRASTHNCRMVTVIDTQIKLTLEKGQKPRSLRENLFVCKAYDYILYKYPVETLRMMNIHEDHMTGMLIHLISENKTTPENSSGHFKKMHNKSFY